MASRCQLGWRDPGPLNRLAAKKEKEVFSVPYLVNSSAAPGFAAFSGDNIQCGA